MKYLLILTGLIACGVAPAVTDTGLESREIRPLVKFLEKEPLSEDAPLVRRELLRWEERNSAEVDVLVCPNLLAPLPDQAIQFNSELTTQYMFGIMAYQLANPTLRDHSNVYPAQLAGMRSLLRSYSVIAAQKQGAHIPEFDELLKQEERGTLEQHFRLEVAAKCSWTKT